MAEASGEVDVVGIGSLPPWATETTAEAMVESMAALVKLTEAQQKGIVDQLQKNGKITEDGLTDAKKTGLLGSLKNDLKTAGDSALDTAAGLGKLPSPLRDFGKSLKDSSKAFKIGLIGINLLGTAVGVAVKTIRESADAMRDIADVGITIPGGITELQRSLAETGMTLGDLSEITTKYSQAVGQNSLRAITKLTASVNTARGGFTAYGLTTAEATEFTAQYLEQQRLAGVTGQASARNEAAAVQQNIERLTAYSKVLNISRKHMMETTTALMGREDVQARFAVLDVNQRKLAQAAYKKTMEAFTALGPKGEEFGVMLTDMLGNPIAESSETFKQLAAVSPELAKTMAGASRNIAKGIPLTIEQTKRMMNLSQAEKDRLRNMSIGNSESAQMAKKLLAASNVTAEIAATAAETKKAFDIAKEANPELTMEEFNTTVSKSAKNAAGIDDALNKLRAKGIYATTTAFLALVGDDNGGIQAAINGINALGDKLMAGSEKTNDWISKWRESFDSPITSVITGLGLVSVALMAFPLMVKGVGKLIWKGGAMLMAKISGKAGVKVAGAGAKVAGKVGVEAGIKAGEKGLLKAFGKSALKKIPVIGLLAGLGFGAWRLAKGDYAGAAMEAASGAASLIPGAGTAASIAIDAGIVARDLARSKGDATKVEEAMAAGSDTTMPTSDGYVADTTSSMDMSKLSAAEQTNYYLSELLRINKRGFQGMSDNAYA